MKSESSRIIFTIFDTLFSHVSYSKNKDFFTLSPVKRVLIILNSRINNN